jgi:hypothetical protein
MSTILNALKKARTEREKKHDTQAAATTRSPLPGTSRHAAAPSPRTNSPPHAPAHSFSQPNQYQTSTASLLAAALIVGLLAALAGGAVVYFLLSREQAQASVHSTAVAATGNPEPGDSPRFSGIQLAAAGTGGDGPAAQRSGPTGRQKPSFSRPSSSGNRFQRGPIRFERPTPSPKPPFLPEGTIIFIDDDYLDDLLSDDFIYRGRPPLAPPAITPLAPATPYPTVTPVPTPLPTEKATPTPLETKPDFTEGSVLRPHQLGLDISGILWDPESPSALINGEIVNPGDTVGDVKILEIRRDRFLVEYDGKKYEVKY